jgi:transcriptional regulator with XRE-family HTH domain
METMHAGAGRGNDRDGAAVDTVLNLERAGPTAARMLAGAELRRLREAAGLSREQAGYAIRSSAPKISRLELGRTGFKQRDVADLLALYGVHDEAERATMLTLARQASTPGWWHAYSGVLPAWFESYLGLEQDACLIRSYQVQFVPGLLQTEEYARAIIGLDLSANDEQTEQRVRIRMRRQQILRRPGPPQLWVVIDEAALRRQVGGTEVMRGQIRHLIDVAQLSHIKIQVVALSAGGHAAGGGPITLLRFPGERIADMVYLEQLDSAVYPARPADLGYYWNVLNRLATEAESPAASIGTLRTILAGT